MPAREPLPSLQCWHLHYYTCPRENPYRHFNVGTYTTTHARERTLTVTSMLTLTLLHMPAREPLPSLQCWHLHYYTLPAREPLRHFNVDTYTTTHAHERTLTVTSMLTLTLLHMPTREPLPSLQCWHLHYYTCPRENPYRHFNVDTYTTTHAHERTLTSLQC